MDVNMTTKTRGSLLMQKGRAFVSVALSAGSFALAAAACDGEPSSTFNTNEDSGFVSPGPGFDIDGGSMGNDATGPVNCAPSLPATFAPVWKPPTKATACSPDELGEYFDACLSNAKSDAGDPCKAWTEAHAQCAACIEPTDNSGAIQWHRERYYYTLNVAGCLALERSEPNEGQCPATYAASIQCQRESCGDCFQTPNATFADFQRCQASAKASACASRAAKVAEVCGTNYTDPDGGAFDCFPKSKNEAPKDHFVRVEGIFCGR
jgi:hypothetical protein